MSGTLNLLNPGSSTDGTASSKGGVPLLQMPPSPMSQMGTLLDVQGKAIQNQQQSLAYQQAQLAPAYSSLGDVVARGSAATQGDILNALAAAHRGGANTDGLQQEMTDRLAVPGETPASVAKMLWMRGQSAASQAELALPPAPVMQNIGGQLVTGQFGARAGPGAATFTQTGALPLGPSVGQQQDWQQFWNKDIPVQTKNPDGTYTATTIPYYKQQGYTAPPPYPGAGAGTGGGGGGPSAPSAYPPGFTGRPPAPGQPQPGQPSPAPSTGPSTSLDATGRPIATGIPTGAGQSVEADQKAYQADAAAVPQHNNNIIGLQKAYTALGLANTGPGTDRVHNAYAFLQGQGLLPSGLNQDETTVNWALAHKYLMDFARGQGMAGGTDLQAMLAQGSNASTDIPKQAALDVVRTNIARERMAIAQVQEAPNTSGAGYINHAATFTPSQHILGYEADMLPPDELKKLQAMKANDSVGYAKFSASLGIAKKHGLITQAAIDQQKKLLAAPPSPNATPPSIGTAPSPPLVPTSP